MKSVFRLVLYDKIFTDAYICVCTEMTPHLLLKLVHEGNGVGQGLLLVASQCLQIQDGLGSLSLQHADGLEQSLIA